MCIHESLYSGSRAVLVNVFLMSRPGPIAVPQFGTNRLAFNAAGGSRALQLEFTGVCFAMYDWELSSFATSLSRENDRVLEDVYRHASCTTEAVKRGHILVNPGEDGHAVQVLQRLIGVAMWF